MAAGDPTAAAAATLPILRFTKVGLVLVDSITIGSTLPNLRFTLVGLVLVDSITISSSGSVIGSVVLPSSSEAANKLL